MGPLRFIAYACFFLLFGMLPMISDRVLTPTKKSEPMLVKLWKRTEVGRRAGVCFTGVDKTEFSPDAKESEWGRNWAASKEKYLAKVGKKHLIICVGRLSPEKGVDELIKVLPRLKDCALWLVGDGPHRPHLEQLARELKVPVQFLGYQSGDALHSVYCQADLFVCPSLTETFGQTVNEALASQVRVALPSVAVFNEAYGAAIPADAFWKPLDQTDMARAISRQLQRHAKNDACGIPNLDKLKSWPDACEALLQEYHDAFQDRQHTFTLFCWAYFPIWWTFSAMTIISFFVFSQIRTFCGGSVRLFFRSSAESVLIKVASLQRLPSANSLQRMEKGQKNSVH
jgi:glycosyltransferase involved in cell wall biosynthesis